jgi:reverse gyrase
LEVDEVFIATDPDTEGEKIAYDLYNLIKPYNIEIYRIEYHEVTKRAILQAIEERRKLDENLVRAQIVRRIADRRVGFSLSEKLQKYFNSPNYSA